MISPVSLQPPQQTFIPCFFNELFHHNHCLFGRIPRIFHRDNIFCRNCRITGIVQRRKMYQFCKFPFCITCCLFSKIFTFITQNRQTVFQNPQILIPFHPEMSHISVIIEIHLQQKILEENGHNRFALIYDKYIFSILLA